MSTGINIIRLRDSPPHLYAQHRLYILLYNIDIQRKFFYTLRIPVVLFFILLCQEGRQRVSLGPVSHAGHGFCKLAGLFMPAAFTAQTLHRKDRLGGERGRKGRMGETLWEKLFSQILSALPLGFCFHNSINFSAFHVVKREKRSAWKSPLRMQSLRGELSICWAAWNNEANISISVK